MASNDNSAGRQQNRRVEIIVSNPAEVAASAVDLELTQRAGRDAGPFSCLSPVAAPNSVYCSGLCPWRVYTGRHEYTSRSSLRIAARNAGASCQSCAGHRRAQTSGLTVEQRLQRVEDELAIRRVLVEYSATQDAHDYAGYAALFARDGEWVNGKTVHKGREAILKMLVDLYGAPPPGYVNSESYHITSNRADRLARRPGHGSFAASAGDARRQWRADTGPGRSL